MGIPSDSSLKYSYAAWADPSSIAITFPKTNDDFSDAVSTLKSHYSDKFGVPTVYTTAATVEEQYAASIGATVGDAISSSWSGTTATGSSDAYQGQKLSKTRNSSSTGNATYNVGTSDFVAKATLYLTDYYEPIFSFLGSPSGTMMFGVSSSCYASVDYQGASNSTSNIMSFSDSTTATLDSTAYRLKSVEPVVIYIYSFGGNVYFVDRNGNLLKMFEAVSSTSLYFGVKGAEAILTDLTVKELDASDYSDSSVINLKLNESFDEGAAKTYVENDVLVFEADSVITLSAAAQYFAEMNAPRNMAPIFEVSENANKSVAITLTDNGGDTRTYSYVWGDEFTSFGTDKKMYTDTYSFDTTKWSTGVKRMSASNSVVEGHQMKLSSKPDSIYVSNGTLTLKNYKVDNGDGTYTYICPDNFQTTNMMNYRYGYAEIRAKVPFMTSVWPSFWGETIKGEKAVRTPPYISGTHGPEDDQVTVETDIFEVFGYRNELEYTVHKHYRKTVDGIAYSANATYNAEAHTALPEIFSNYTNLSNEWHTFGFEWTPTEMNVYIDGICYASLDITNNNSFADDATVDANTYDTVTSNGKGGYTYTNESGVTPFNADDMKAFHDPLQIFFNNHLFMDQVADGVNGAGCVEFNSSYSSSEYAIDYFRLYQDPTMNDGGVNYGAEQVLYSGIWTKY